MFTEDYKHMIITFPKFVILEVTIHFKITDH